MLKRNIQLIHYIVKRYPGNNVSVSYSVSYRFKSTKANEKERGKIKECPKDGSGRGFYYTLGGIIIASGALVAYANYDDDFRDFLRDKAPYLNEFVAFVTAEEGSHVDYLIKYFTSIKESIHNGILKLTGSEEEKDKCKEEKFEAPKSVYGVLNSEVGENAPPSAYGDLKEDKKKKREKKEEDKIEDDKKEEKKSDGQEVAPTQGGQDKGEVKKEKKPYKEDKNKKYVEEKCEEPKNVKDDTKDDTKKPVEEKDKRKEKQKQVLEDVILLEKSINDAAQTAIKAYSEATCIIKEYSGKVFKLVEESVENVDPKIWAQLKELSAEKEKALKTADGNAREAMEKIEMLKEYLNDPFMVGGDERKHKARCNIIKIIAAVDETRKNYEQEKLRLSVTEKYWKKVQDARRHFAEELEILFPSVNIYDRNMKLADTDLDLFILYAFQNILFYQKELTKLDTLMKGKLEMLECTKVSDRQVMDQVIEKEMESERRKIGQEFQKKMLTLRAECEKDMRQQMKRQEQAHSDHMAEAMLLKERETERRMQRTLDDQVLQVKTNYKKELAGLVGRLRALDDVIKKRADQDKRAQRSQGLWSASQNLENALKSADPSLPPQEQLKPLREEVQAVSNAADDGDELVEAVIATIPREAYARGIFTDIGLRERFLRVERVAKRVALLPEGGASMPVMFLSYLQSLLIISNPVAVPAHELANQPFDPSSLNTFDILQRARFWMDRGDFAQALRYMNLLEGAPKAVARDWIKECRLFLEVQQAAQALMTHAAANGLIYS